MKKLLLCCLLASTGTAGYASEYGCKVLLCLSNPASNGGPKGVAECVAPINQLYHDFARGRPFPSCDLSDGNDGASYAVRVFDPYDPCPASLHPAPAGTYVVQGRAGGNAAQAAVLGYVLSGRPQVSQPQSEFGGATGPRACVGRQVGAYQMGGYDDGYTVSVFDQVVWQQPQSPNAIDVYVDRTWQQRIHW
jgi:hypothetical protein